MKFLKEDINIEFLFLNILILAVLLAATAFYNLRLDSMQEEYDRKVANLEQIEKQLIAQEEKLKDIAMAKNSINMDKQELEQEYASMKDGYESLRLELDGMESRPFSKSICRASGDAEC